MLITVVYLYSTNNNNLKNKNYEQRTKNYRVVEKTK